jgi:hypothetical protein
MTTTTTYADFAAYRLARQLDELAPAAPLTIVGLDERRTVNPSLWRVSDAELDRAAESLARRNASLRTSVYQA